MRRYCSSVGIGLLGLLAAGVMLAQSQTGTQPPGDVFSSRGAPDDRRKYLSPDGRSFDRCGYETAHMADLPDTRMHGMPDHVPIDRDIMSQYVRCAVDACAPNQNAVCWGKQSRQNPVMPEGADSFNSNGFTNCQADGMAVVCDPPKDAKVSFKLYAKVDTSKMSGYCENYAKTLPPMSGQTVFPRATVYVNTPAGLPWDKAWRGR
jgi:hypothetical protein